MLKHAIFIFLFSLGICAHSQCIQWSSAGLSAEAKIICDSLSRATEVESEAIYASGRHSEIYPYLQKLETTCTEKQLVQLTTYPNVIVRCYAFWGLLEKKASRKAVLQVVYRHLCDTAKVETQTGCLGHTTTVGDFMLNEIKYDKVYKPNKSESKRIDSLLFWVPGNGLLARNWVVEQTQLTKENYSRMRALFVEEQVDEALLNMLSAKNKKDLELISIELERNPGKAFEAIARYPEEQFIAPMKAWQLSHVDDPYNSAWSDFYSAALAYNNAFSLETLAALLQGDISPVREEQAEYVYRALKADKNKKYDSIKINTLNYLRDMEPAYFRQLWQTDSTQCLRIIEYRLTTQEHPFWQESLLNMMADKIMAHEKENAVTVINKVLMVGYSSTFHVFSQRAASIHNAETIEIYKKRFDAQETQSAQSLDYCIDAILAFNNKELYTALKQKAAYYITLEKFQQSRRLNKLMEKING